MSLNPDSHLMCKVVIETYISGSPDTFPKPGVEMWEVYELVCYDNVLHEDDDTEIIKPS